MPLLIDGHNLIGRLPDIHLEDPDDEVRLISRLQAYAGRTGKRVTVVFDRGLPGGRSRNLSGGRVEVIFAATGHTADGVIRERLRRSQNPRGLTVVTSDRAVIAAAKAQGTRVIRSEDFADRLKAPSAPRTSVKEEAHLSEEDVEAWLRIFGAERG